MYIYGKNAVSEFLKKNEKINKIYLWKKFQEQNIISELQKSKIKILRVEKIDLDKLVNKNHQGIILEVADYQYATIDDLYNSENEIIVILDHLEDPHNFGAIIRTCEAFKVGGLIIPKDRSVSVNDTVVKVSAGAIYNIKIAMVVNLVTTITELKKRGYWIIGTDMSGEDCLKIDYQGKIGIVIGNEGRGMSRLIKENCDFIATIPMKGDINSLNASVATGIILYQATCSRR